MGLKKFLVNICNNLLRKGTYKDIFKNYKKRYERNTFVNGYYKNYNQYEAVITKLYHAIEKGLSYINYRAGFGENNILELINVMKNYSLTYDVNAFFYKTALCVLDEYVKKNREYGYENKEIESKIKELPGIANDAGGVVAFELIKEAVNFEEFIKSRHSIREFSDESVDIKKLFDAIKLSQYTPSACNRQGWKTRIITDRQTMNTILNNQNGNRGFGDKLDKLLVITCDLCYFGKTREVHQAFIDGGMYAMNVLHSLHYYNVATIPLSASLNATQEENVRKAISIKDSEVLIMFIGVGNYPQKCITTRSERRRKSNSCICTPVVFELPQFVRTVQKHPYVGNI